MKFEIKNRFTGDVQFTAEIECGDDTDYAIKVSFAVKWAIKNRANLSGADLSRADLSCADGQSATEARSAFALLWNTINGPGAWEANPWVAAYSFTVHNRNIDAMGET